MYRFPLLTVLLVIGAILAPALASETTTVLLVRHAEKAAEHGDPPLTDFGRERARELARVLKRVGVDVAICSQFRRTRETLEPLAEGRGLRILEVPVEDPEHSSRELAARILREFRGRTVVVAGHSNTVPAIVEGLGAGERPEIPDERNDDLFVVTVGADGARVVRLAYGAPSP